MARRSHISEVGREGLSAALKGKRGLMRKMIVMKMTFLGAGRLLHCVDLVVVKYF